ncbi:MAG: hypothetical protein R2741_11225 [Methanolobus sp.]
MNDEEVVKVALVSCGSEYAGVHGELTSVAESVNAKLVYPEIEIDGP